MKVLKRKYKCAICEEENEYLDYLSYSMRGYNDFDLKPPLNESMIGGNIKECPNCHYCNYDIDKFIEKQYEGESIEEKLKLWQENDEVNFLFDEQNENLRKILILAQQYRCISDYEKQYNLLIQATWVCKDEEKIQEIRRTALNLFDDHIIPQYREKLLQAADLLRMESEFKIAQMCLKSANILNNDKNLNKVIKAEKKFINKKDTKRHSLKEVFE